MRTIVRCVAVVVALLLCSEASAQWEKERGWVRKGNRQYNRENINGSIESYQEALKHNPNCFEAKYDLASALYRAKRYDASEKMLQSIVNDSTRTVLERGEVAYNLGNTQFAQQKFKEALSSYRFAMRCNPNDEDAKHNYALTKLMLKQQEQQQQQDKDKEQNQDNKENQQGKNDQNKGDDKNQDGQPPQEQEGKPEKQDEGSRPESGMSQKQQEALLQAVQAEEDKTQDKLKEKAGVLIRGGKNW